MHPFGCYATHPHDNFCLPQPQQSDVKKAYGWK